MGKKHDEIVMSLTKEKITRLIIENDLLGKKGVWSSYHEILKSAKDIPLSEYKLIPEDYNDIPLYDVLKKFKEDYDKVLNLGINDSLEIKKRLEVPIIKGEGQYRTTKGFLDIFVEVIPKFYGEFKPFQDIGCKGIVIEVKQKKDFEDMGSIIRQVNEYREYFKYQYPLIWIIYCDEDIEDSKKFMIEDEEIIFITNNDTKE